MIKNTLGGAIINYGRTLPDALETPDGSLFIKTGDGSEGLYAYRLFSDLNTGAIGNQSGAVWTLLLSLGGALNADTLNGLPSSAFQLADSDLTALAAVTTTGILVRTGAATFETRALAGSSTINITDPGGVFGTPTFTVNQAGLSLNSIGGTLAVNKGGTGSTVVQPAGRVMFSDGTNIVATAGGAAPSGSGVTLNRQVLISNGGAAPSWVNSTSLNVAYATQAANADSADTATTALSTNTAANVTVVADGTNAAQFISFYSAQSGALPTRTDAGLTYNPSTNSLSVTGTMNSADVTITDANPTVFLIETGGTQKPGFLYLNENVFSIRTHAVGSNTISGSTALISTNFLTAGITLAGDVSTTANASLGATGSLTVAGTASISGATSISDTLTVVGNFVTTLGGQLTTAGTISSASGFRAPNGSPAAPGYAFQGATTTGLFFAGPNAFGIGAGGTNIATVTSTGITLNSGAQFFGDAGSGAAAPTYSFAGDSNTGMWGSANLIAFSTGGVTRLQVSTTEVTAFVPITATALTSTGSLAVNNNIIAGGTITTGNLVATGSIQASGNITAFAPSDRRLKTDIKQLSGALAKVKDLVGVSYTLVEGGRKEMGLIAQDTEQVVPEVVRQGSDGVYGIAYGNLAGLLVEAIKELDSRLSVIEERIFRDEQ